MISVTEASKWDDVLTSTLDSPQLSLCCDCQVTHTYCYSPASTFIFHSILTYLWSCPLLVFHHHTFTHLLVTLHINNNLIKLYSSKIFVLRVISRSWDEVIFQMSFKNQHTECKSPHNIKQHPNMRLHLKLHTANTFLVIKVDTTLGLWHQRLRWQIEI